MSAADRLAARKRARIRTLSWARRCWRPWTGALPLVRDVVRTHHASSAEASSADAPAAAAPRGLPFVKRLFGPRDDADWRARLTEIACVADRFTALTAHDPERPARTHRQIMLELTRQARSQLSHEVVVALLLNWAPADAIAGSQQSRSAERYAA